MARASQQNVPFRWQESLHGTCLSSSSCCSLVAHWSSRGWPTEVSFCLRDCSSACSHTFVDSLVKDTSFLVLSSNWIELFQSTELTRGCQSQGCCASAISQWRVFVQSALSRHQDLNYLLQVQKTLLAKPPDAPAAGQETLVFELGTFFSLLCDRNLLPCHWFNHFFITWHCAFDGFTEGPDGSSDTWRNGDLFLTLSFVPIVPIPGSFSLSALDKLKLEL